jgi:hypothetical protein
MEKPLIFISCGQYTPEEAALGTAIARFITEETPYASYFAEEQNTLDGLVTNILGALDRAVGFIAVMHKRGTVTVPGGTLERGSVWVEQEIAIAAFAQHVLKRSIEVALYLQTGIALEGIRQQLRLKAVQFNTAEEILADLPERLRSWRLEGRRYGKLSLKARYIDAVKPGFVVAIANEGDTAIRAPYLALTLPAPFGIDQWGIDGNGHHGLPQLPRAPQDRKPKFGDAATVIHPGFILDVTRVVYKGNPETNPKCVEIEFEVTAEGVGQVSDILRVDF